MSALALAVLLGAQMPPGRVVPAPPTLDVLVLGKQTPRWLQLVEGRCRTEGGVEVQHISARRGLVRACGAAPRKGPRPCTDTASVELECASSAVVRGPAVTRRTLGRRLRARVSGAGLRVIAAVPVEEYVAGVVASEIGGAPLEARRAQAVLARSFALRAVGSPRHDDAPLCDLTHCQAFAGAKPPIPPRTGIGNVVLVDSTGAIADVFFHSTCGGRTVSPRDAWGVKTAPEVVGVDDVDHEGRAWCRRSGHYRWVHELPDRTLVDALGALAPRPLDAGSLIMEPATKDGTRWRLGDREGVELVDGEALHLQLSRALGFSAVKSSLFAVRRAGEQLRLSGSGLGHRVGMCQMGTIARAQAGQSAREMLLGYFPKLDLATVVESSR